MKDTEQQLMDEIGTLKKKMAEDKKNSDKPKIDKKEKKATKKSTTPHSGHKMILASLPFIIIIVFLIGFFAGVAYQKNAAMQIDGSDISGVPDDDTTPDTTPDVNPVAPENFCSETDDGVDRNVKGTTYFNDAVYYDTCDDQKTLREYSCNADGTFTTTRIGCDLCEDGLCLEFETRSKDCKETDNYVDFDTKGYVMDGGEIFEDVCSRNSLEEYYCNTFGVVDTQYTLCDKCENGACVPVEETASKCTDTDTGIIIYTKGTVVDAAGRTETDNCQGRNLEEFYCDPFGYVAKTYKLCTQCVEGACVET